MLTVAFTGDVHCGETYRDPQVFDEDILRVCNQSDYVVVNVEGPITSSPPQATHDYLLHSDPQSSAIFHALGNNVFNLANNHAFDHGWDGLRDTIQLAESRGWPFLGAGANLAEASKSCILEHDGITVGLVSVCGCVRVSSARGSSTLVRALTTTYHRQLPFAIRSSAGVFGESPESHVREKIRELKKHVRWVVVVYHGGEEFSHVPIPARRRRMLRYLDYGADVVMGHHAHCVQRYEMVGDKHVYYGLGNLLFDYELHRQYEGTDESVLLSLSFSDKSLDVHPTFTWQDRDKHVVSKVASNRNFALISKDTYLREWELEASHRFQLMREIRNIDSSLHGWKKTLALLKKKLLRTGLLALLLRNELVRPYIVTGVKCSLRNLLRRSRREDQSPPRQSLAQITSKKKNET